MTIKELFSAFAEEYNIPWAQLNLEPEAPDQICIMIDGKNGRYEGHALCLEEEGLFVFYTLLGVRVPEENGKTITFADGVKLPIKDREFFYRRRNRGTDCQNDTVPDGCRLGKTGFSGETGGRLRKDSRLLLSADYEMDVWMKCVLLIILHVFADDEGKEQAEK